MGGYFARERIIAMKGAYNVVNCNVVPDDAPPIPVNSAVVSSSIQPHSQRVRIFEAWLACNDTIKALEKPNDGGLYCEPVWDNVMCWPDYTPAGRLVQQQCAEYIEGFDINKKAYRYCMMNGEWAIHPDVKINTSWTNFLNCTKQTTGNTGNTMHPDIVHHMPNITIISTVGYSMSLAFLLVATILMVKLKKLHCQRNTIHINLFVSFIFRAVVSLVRNGALDKGFAFSWDFDYDHNGTLLFDEKMTHWECKLLNALHHYALNANYAWIFVEGLYLHTLIFYAVYSQGKKYFKLYIIIGWTFPLVFVIIWIFLRIYKNNVLCWNTHEQNYYWVLEAPNIATILINFFFFLNIIRVLFTKIRNCNTRDPRRFRKLAKSTLVLIPLFGVYYIIFIILTRHRRPDIAIAHMYLEMTLNSFQGIVVALLFCFLNGEVRAEVSKRWNRHWLSRRCSTTSARSSRAFSTSSSILRERFSLPQVVSSVHDNKSQNHPSISNQMTCNDATDTNPVTSSEKHPVETISKVPSQPKVTFGFVDNRNYCDDSLPKGSQPVVTTDGCHLSESGEQDHLIPLNDADDNSVIFFVNESKKSQKVCVTDRNCDDIQQHSAGFQGSDSPSSTLMPFPSSKGLR